MIDIIEELKKKLDDPKYQEIIRKNLEHNKFLTELKDEQLEWFDSIGPERRARYIQKVIDKYKSKKYKDRWFFRSTFPPQPLFDYIYDYAYKYGKCWNAIPEEAGPGFDKKFVFDNWKVLLYTGQGYMIFIDKVTDEDIKAGPDKLGQKWLGHEYDDHLYYETLTKEFE